MKAPEGDVVLGGAALQRCDKDRLLIQSGFRGCGRSHFAGWQSLSGSKPPLIIAPLSARVELVPFPVVPNPGFSRRLFSRSGCKGHT